MPVRGKPWRLDKPDPNASYVLRKYPLDIEGKRVAVGDRIKGTDLPYRRLTQLVKWRFLTIDLAGETLAPAKSQPIPPEAVASIQRPQRPSPQRAARQEPVTTRPQLPSAE